MWLRSAVGQHHQLRMQRYRRAPLQNNGGQPGRRTNLLLIKDSKPSKRNTSGVRGVSYKSKKGKWEASICFQGKTHYLGMYSTLEQAAAARKAAEEKYYKPMLDKWENQKKLKNSAGKK